MKKPIKDSDSDDDDEPKEKETSESILADIVKKFCESKGSNNNGYVIRTFLFLFFIRRQK